MVKQGLVNYFKSLKHFFTPLGTMFLGIMLGLSAFVPCVVSAASTLVDSVKQLSQNVNLDVAVLLDNVWSHTLALDWNNPIEAIQTLFSFEWINYTLTESLGVILGTDLDTFNAEIVNYVKVFFQSAIDGVIVFFVFWILGFIAGYWLIRFLIRRDIAKRSLWKFVLAYFVNSLLSTLFVVATLVLFAIWQYSVIFSVILAALLSGIIALLQAYLLYAVKKVKLSDVVNVKNAGLHILTNLIIFAFSVLFTLVAVAINALMGIFVGLSLFAIAGIVVNLNAESYVIEQVKNAGETAKDIVLQQDVTANEIK